MESNIENLLQDILLELKSINSKIDSMTVNGVYGFSDVCDAIDDGNMEISAKIENLAGSGLYNSIADIYNKIDEVKGNGIYDSISDICDKLDRLD